MPLESNKRETAPVTIDDISLDLDPAGLLRTLRLENSHEYMELVTGLAEDASGMRGPRAAFLRAYVEERGEDFVTMNGVRFESRVLAVNLSKIHKAYPFLATCGNELGEWADSFAHPLERLIAEAIRGQGLLAAMAELDRRIGLELGHGELSMMNPGSIPDWPLEQQRPLLELLAGAAGKTGVRIKDDLFMDPPLTVSGIKFASESRFESCMLCSREDCPGRRADYDPDLYRNRYGKG